MASLYLSLGTNLGDRRSNLETALALVDRRIGTITGASDIIETESLLNLIWEERWLLKGTALCWDV